jgi:uncharacterized membrane protein
MSSSHKAKTDLEIAKLAWVSMGGTGAIWKSFDFRVALAVSLLCWPAWLAPEWWEKAISVLPNLLGFTLGGFAIFLGFGSDQFKELIARKDEAKSEYLSVSSTFLFIVAVQVVGLLYAIICESLWVPTPTLLKPISHIIPYLNYLAWFIGFFLFMLGIVLSLRAAIRIFRISRWYNSFLVFNTEERDDTQN